MNKKEVYTYYRDLVQMLKGDDLSELYKALDIFSPLTKTLRTEAKDLFVESQMGQQVRRMIGAEISQAINSEKALDFRLLILQSYKLEELLKGMKQSFESKEVLFIERLQASIESFLNEYSIHNRAYNQNTFLPLALAANELKTLLDATLKMSEAYSFVPNNEVDEFHGTLELYLSNVTSLKDFSIKLAAIHEIYTELLHLYGVTESDFPVVIEHIENGSLWLKFAGHGLTSTALTIILTSATNYYQENFSISGQLKQLPASVQTLNELLKISETLEKDGIDTNEIKDHLVSATKKISHRLDDLLGDQPSVEINEKRISLGELQQNKMIEAKMRVLPHNDS